MIFDELPIGDCKGAFLAHAVAITGGVLKKGRILGEEEIASLRAAGIARVMVARMGPGDVAEDQAALRLAEALAAPALRVDPPFTGRVNLFAQSAGVIRIDKARIDAINAIDEAVTVASLPDWSAVASGQMVATVKIIPFAVPEAALARGVAAAAGETPAFRLSPFRPREVALVQTMLPTLKASVADKTVEITNRRLAAMNCAKARETRCPHEILALSQTIRRAKDTGAGMILVMGASAITDRRDVIPAAILESGGEIIQFGMPVDPGNLILLARIGQVPVLGLPGCARSPKANGCDWVMQRLMADLPVEAADLRAMGVGGLLMEIPTRPQPREGGERAATARGPRVAAIVLAAGKSSRMGENKLLLDDSGRPIIARSIDHAIEAGVAEVIVVLGHQAGALRQALSGRKIRIALAEDFAAGMSASLKAGIAALPPGTDAALVMLGDMPRVGPGTLRRLIDAYKPLEGRSIVVPVHHGKRGNPVLLDRRFFAEIAALSGDVGARHLIGEHGDQVVEVEIEDAGVFLDVDTPEAYRLLVPAVADE